MLPAHLTKHRPLLDHGSFCLAQSDAGISNGTALWLGAQCLSAYLGSLKASPGVLVELGSGIGLVALTMSSLGWQVLATDIPHVVSTVLSPNIQNNPSHSGSIQVRELDWTVPPDAWTWEHPSVIASPSAASLKPSSSTQNQILLQPPFDLICTADTVYNSALVQPLLRTLHALCLLSSARSPPIYMCLERRDPVLVDRCLSDAHHTWGFHVHRIPHRKLVKAMHKAGMNWPKEDWEGIEIWKFTLPRT